MLKKYAIRLLVAFSLVITLTGGTGVAGGALGWDVTSQVEAGTCSGGGSGGGGC